MNRYDDYPRMANTIYATDVIDYVRWKRSTITDRTAYRTTCELLRFGRFHGMNTRHVTLEMCQDWVDSKRAHGTQRTAYSDLNLFFTWCLRKGRVRNNPMLEVRVPDPPASSPRSISQESADAILAACADERQRLVALLMMRMGLRARECALAEIGDISFRSRTMAVRGKGGQDDVTRRVPITDDVYAALEAYLDKYPASAGPLIRSYREARDGSAAAMSARWLSIQMSRIFQDAGIKRYAYDGMSAHALRHTAATELVEAGAPLTVVQGLLGHKELSTTQIYISGAEPETGKWLKKTAKKRAKEKAKEMARAKKG